MSTVRWESIFNNDIMKWPPTPACNVADHHSSPINKDAAGGHTDDAMSLGSVPSSVSHLDVDLGHEEDGAPSVWSTMVGELFDWQIGPPLPGSSKLLWTG